MNRGVLYAVGAYTIWGISPIYWKLIQNVPALEIVGHRMLWSFILVFGVVVITKDLPKVISALRSWKIILIFFATSSLLAVNWLVYIRAVNSGFIVDASLGYFINPVVSVLLGVIFLKERLRIWQWITVLIAFFGVLYLTISYGSLPKIGLILAFTFGIYGLVRKLVPLKSIHGFTLETGFMVIPALIYLMMLYNGGPGTMGQTTINQTLLLVLTGFVTALPLVMFGVAALLINLSTLGFIQYIAPTLQFLIGVLVYGEAFTQDRLIGFGVIWIALAIFTIEGAFARRKIPVTTPAD
jgi:chloramphenicol-sensitive protein RarD